MLSKIKSYGLKGLEGFLVEVEVDLRQGLPVFDIVGLADTSVKEARERVKSAIKNSGLGFPILRVIVNLAPADTKKVGSVYDAAVAVGILKSCDVIPKHSADNFVILGELSLDGSLREIKGILPMLISAVQSGYKNFIVPYNNVREASYIEGANVFGVKNLRELTDFLNLDLHIAPAEKRVWDSASLKPTHLDFANVYGQTSAKRALEIAAAGGHNVMLLGPPGTGKTLLAKSFPSILPPLTFEEALEVTKIHSVAGILDKSAGIVRERPYRSPHHTTTAVTLTGGGRTAKPGEVSLAHNGVLYLDEMPEYSRATLETLRQPLENGSISVSRLEVAVEYPANFTLLASMNPCPCGHYGSEMVECRCSASQIHKYLGRVSRPLLDRIDLHIEVDNVNYADLTKKNKAEETSEKVRQRVIRAREIQLKRFKGQGIYHNSQMNNSQIEEFCTLCEDCDRLLKHAYEALNLSARGYHRILKVARTIADLQGEKDITPHHIGEALQFRELDRKF